MRKSKGFKLRTILSMLVIGSVLLTAIIGGYLAISGNVRSLSSNYLENNYGYAKKLASNTNDLLNVLQNNMMSIADIAGDESFSQKELDMLFKGNEQYFNSIIIADTSRIIKFVSPGNTGLVAGALITSDASLQATMYRKSNISEPYVGATGRLILLISAPIYNDKGSYIGLAGGTIYLQDDNVLSRMLGEHYYGNGSYVYVVDSEGRILYHPEEGRVNEIVIDNAVVNKVISGRNGSDQVTNSMGTTFFAGYAYEPISGWGVVSQTPISVLDKPKWDLIRNMLQKNIPLFFIILIIALRVSSYISKPLNILVKFSEDALDSQKANPPSLPKVNSFIYDVRQLHKSMDKYLDLLNAEIQTDSLTGLSNRKTFDRTIQEWFDEQIAFSLILIDLDYFKLINDEFGHTRGDEALRYVASQLEAVASAEDLSFRYGGEEFGILVKFGGKQDAVNLAEKLRKKLETSEIFNGQVITISIGIAFSCDNIESPQKLVEMADAALYQSKNEGRNRTTVYSDDEM
ncbi:sensor domain-containing diguanylate cyclase [Paenibacillus sp. FA6]|uniref:sensor domain-containing diguanylate cyclase n=1 Tax=Paenibacillus sp. FA6 TaxID=3413029 RepID=UPI003F65D4DB